jgi:hypothetical protein
MRLMLGGDAPSSLARTNAHVKTVPTADRPTSSHIELDRAEANAAGSARPACRSLSSTAWKTAPPAESVMAPASTRFIPSTPAAMLAFACGMAVIAAVDIGA